MSAAPPLNDAGARFGPKTVLAAVVVAELVYIVGRFFISAQAADPIRRELIASGWRLVFVAIYLRMAWPTLKGAGRLSIGRSPLIIGAIVLLLTVVPLSWQPHTADTIFLVVYAATTPIVALREELAYRVLLAGTLSKWMPAGIALVLSTAAFVAYHAGTQRMDVMPISAMAAIGVILCVIYIRTGSLLVITILHTLVDWIVLMPREWAAMNGLVLIANLAMAGLALAWWRRAGGSTQAAT